MLLLIMLLNDKDIQDLTLEQFEEVVIKPLRKREVLHETLNRGTNTKSTKPNLNYGTQVGAMQNDYNYRGGYGRGRGYGNKSGYHGKGRGRQHSRSSYGRGNYYNDRNQRKQYPKYGGKGKYQGKYNPKGRQSNKRGHGKKGGFQQKYPTKSRSGERFNAGKITKAQIKERIDNWDIFALVCLTTCPTCTFYGHHKKLCPFIKHGLKKELYRLAKWISRRKKDRNSNKDKNYSTKHANVTQDTKGAPKTPNKRQTNQSNENNSNSNSNSNSSQSHQINLLLEDTNVQSLNAAQKRDDSPHINIVQTSSLNEQAAQTHPQARNSSSNINVAISDTDQDTDINSILNTCFDDNTSLSSNNNTNNHA